GQASGGEGSIRSGGLGRVGLVVWSSPAFRHVGVDCPRLRGSPAAGRAAGRTRRRGSPGVDLRSRATGKRARQWAQVRRCRGCPRSCRHVTRMDERSGASGGGPAELPALPRDESAELSVTVAPLLFYNEQRNV